MFCFCCFLFFKTFNRNTLMESVVFGWTFFPRISVKSQPKGTRQSSTATFCSNLQWKSFSLVDYEVNRQGRGLSLKHLCELTTWHLLFKLPGLRQSDLIKSRIDDSDCGRRGKQSAEQGESWRRQLVRIGFGVRLFQTCTGLCLAFPNTRKFEFSQKKNSRTGNPEKICGFFTMLLFYVAALSIYNQSPRQMKSSYS